ncbi:helix-turn-helix transcriptional regulator [Glaciibacter superstes]|uniref:helix-turn-helix transcriptional regulator n=1 Tax=Glaciibacter superstes TaxID=501023 RepID=UPI0003B5C34A|nr:LuxR C-terminal-related transcriptional regulator [Glaciibacter superstes]
MGAEFGLPGFDPQLVDDGLHSLLLAVAAGFDLTAPLPASLAHADEDIDSLIERAHSAGLLLNDGTLVPQVSQAILDTTPVYRLRSLQRELIDHFTTGGRSLDDAATILARAGVKDPRLARNLELAGDTALNSEPEIAALRYDEATAAGLDRSSTAARRAQVASATGDIDGAGRITDVLLALENAPDLVRGVDVAAAVWAQRGMLERSAELYRWLGAERIGSAAAPAAVAMIGIGDRAGADAMLSAPVPSGSPTLLAAAKVLMGEGVRESIGGAPGQALSRLVRASDLCTASGTTMQFPEIPAVLAATVALHSGELGVAESVIDAALAGDQCGPVARPRLLLFRAWIDMYGDRLERAGVAVSEATACGVELTPRDELLLRALEVGLARRTDDALALVRTWKRACEAILHVPVDLYSLLPLEELVVAAGRLRESARVESHLADAWKLLERLGKPPLWSVSLHWSAVQVAILTEQPAALAPPAAALVRESKRNNLAAVLSLAGRAWVLVLAGEVDVALVESAARGLAAAGRTWDGARLAGHGAARAEERKDMARLLACARELHPSAAASVDDQGGKSETTASPRATSGSARGESGLSAREQEIAKLVLDGKTYREIGEAVFISPRTAEHHIARIRHRLGATTRAELLAQLRLALGAQDASVQVGAVQVGATQVGGALPLTP